MNIDSNESENQKKTKKYLKELSELTQNVKYLHQQWQIIYIINLKKRK